MSDLWDMAWIVGDAIQIQSQRQQIQELQSRLFFEQRRRDWSNLKGGRKEKDKVDELEKRVDQLAHLCRALVSVLKESGALDAGKLVDALAKIDSESAKSAEPDSPPVSVKPKRRPRL
jgi:hypothetical protein